MEILNNINKNPAVYANRQAININNKDEQSNEQINNKSLQQEAKAIEHCNKRAYISHKEGAGIPQDNKPAIQGSEVKRTRSGCIVKKTRQITIHLTTIISLADMLATPTNVAWPAALSCNSKHLFL